MIESRNGKKERQIILRLMLHLLDCQKERKNFASSGNRTRAARVAGEHSTTEPTMHLRSPDQIIEGGKIFRSR